MKYTLFLLFGLGLLQAAAAQDLLDAATGSGVAPPATEEPSGPSLGIDQIRTSSGRPVEPINLFSNRFSGADTVEASAATNRVQKSKVGFLMSTGLEYVDDGEYEEAEKAYLRALQEDAQNEEILSRLATLYVTMERYSEAIEIFSELTERFPENSMAHNNLAWCYATGPGVKNKTLALRHAREALLYTPLSPSVWNTLAEAYYVAGEYDKALRSADYALDLAEQLNIGTEQRESFMEQRNKILLAKKAKAMMDGLDEEE